jgi:hypothetical protein
MSSRASLALVALVLFPAARASAAVVQPFPSYFLKFGLYSYDPETGKRHRRPSAKVFRPIARRNGITSNLVKKYCG